MGHINKTYNKSELFEQIKVFLNEDLNSKEFMIDNINIECRLNWVGEDNSGYKILASKDYEIILKVKGF